MSGVGAASFRSQAASQLDYGERRMTAALRHLPEGAYAFTDFMELGDSDVAIRVVVTIADGRLTADFTGSREQVAANFNAVEAVTRSCLYHAVPGGDRSHHSRQRRLLPTTDPWSPRRGRSSTPIRRQRWPRQRRDQPAHRRRPPRGSGPGRPIGSRSLTGDHEQHPGRQRRLRLLRDGGRRGRAVGRGDPGSRASTPG